MSADNESEAESILPLPGQHWVARRKAAVVLAVRDGRTGVDEVCRRYDLSPEELDSWISAFEQYGLAGLRTTRVKIYRDLSEAARPMSRNEVGLKSSRTRFESPSR